MMEIPPMFSGITGLIITSLQLLNIATAYSTETNAKTRARYSKFSQANDISSTWPSRVAMMVIYTPAFIVSVVFLMLGLYGVELPGMTIPSPSLAAVFCAIQFGKRCLEVMFLHKYSGRTEKATPMGISIFYTLVTTLIAHAAGRKDRDEMTEHTLIVGTALFIIGIAGNFYHHYLLARLRTVSNKSSESKKKYVAPRGGLFSYVAAPHYLFELIGWLGVAIVANHLNAYLVFAGMSSYLGGRSVSQHHFNRMNFEERDWSSDRRCLIPFIF